MKAVVACAGSKAEDTGYWATEEGGSVMLVARPGHAPGGDGFL